MILMLRQTQELHKLHSLLIWLLLFGMPATIFAADETSTLTLYRAIEEKAGVTIKNPSSYNRLVVRSSKRDVQNYYVERKPVYVVPRATIESVKVSKSKMANRQEVEENTQDAKSPSKIKIPQRLSDVFYDLTFKITPKEAKSFSAFVNKNKDAVFQVKIGEQSLGVTGFYWPMEVIELEPLEFTMISMEATADNIRRILAPIKDKVIWE